MEELLASIVTTALALTVSLTPVKPADVQPAAYTEVICHHIDADGDGFCDNCNMTHTGANTCGGYTDADGDGICDNCSFSHSGTDTCSGYADLNGDGVCDNCSFSHSGTGTDTACTGYVDADGDGICDNHASGEHCPYSTGHSSHNCPNMSGNNLQYNNSGHHARRGHHNGHH